MSPNKAVSRLIYILSGSGSYQKLIKTIQQENKLSTQTHSTKNNRYFQPRSSLPSNYNALGKSITLGMCLFNNKSVILSIIKITKLLLIL